MLLLTVYKDPAGKRENKEFVRLREAIDFGQQTGFYYEIFDPCTGRIIDWNEINVREDDGWYYDDQEYLWKRLKADDDAEECFSTGNFHFGMTGQSRNLHHARS